MWQPFTNLYSIPIKFTLHLLPSTRYSFSFPILNEFTRIWLGRPFSAAVRRGQFWGTSTILQVFDRFCLRRIPYVRWQQFISNTADHTRCKIGYLQQALLTKATSVVLPYSSTPTGWIHPWGDCSGTPIQKVDGSGFVNSKKQSKSMPNHSWVCSWKCDRLAFADSVATDSRAWLAFVRDIVNSFWRDWLNRSRVNAAVKTKN